ncbi:putative reverse transcriptase domain-containing protein [Tanacetum coccineum]
MSQPANDEFSQHLSDDEESNHEDASDTGAAPKQQQQVIPQTTAISNIKLPILKKEEYDIWAMEMEHYLEYIDNEVWKVIQNGNSKKRISTGKDGIVRVLSPVTAAEIQAVEKERKAKNILLMAIPKEHMRRFHGMDDAKEIWEAIRTRFGGNANSKKMQKAVFKQQFEAFKISNSEGLEKGYDRFQQLLSQLESHGAEVSTEDANHKFLRSLPPAWSNLAMTMRTNPEIDTLSIDDFKSSTNKVKSGFTGAYSTCTPSTSSTNVPEKEVLAGFADEKIGRRVRVDGKTPVGFNKKELECFNCHNTGHFARECTAKGTHDGKKKRDSFYQHQEARKQEKNQMGLLTMDDGIVNWGEHTKDEETNHALMAISSSNESKEGNVDSSKVLDVDLVVTESNETESERHVSSSKSGKDTHAEDADINSVNDKQPLAEVQLTVQHDTLTNEQQHSVQSEPIYDTHLLEKVDRNTILDSTNMYNEKLHKENEHLKTDTKDLYDSIKTTRVQTKDHNDSLIAQINSKTVENADLKAQIQEKVFANVALKNELRKLKGNSVDTKFAKPSILGKPVLQPPRNQSVVRQPMRLNLIDIILKTTFASQVDVNNVLSKPVTQHYLPKGRESAFAKSNHMIASSSSRNSSKNMPRFSSNDML